MGTLIAWQNTIDNKARAIVAIASVCFAVLLLYMQLGFYATAFRSSTLIYDQLAFDLVITSPQYVHLRVAGLLPRRRLPQAAEVSGVARVVPVYIADVSYRNVENGLLQEATALGIEPMDPVFRLPELTSKLPALKRLDTAVMDDVTTNAGLGPIRAATQIEVQGRQLELATTYSHGTGFITDAALIMSVATLARLFPGFSSGRVSLGLVQLEPGARAEVVARELTARLPADTRVWTRGQIEANEQHVFMQVKPSGILFGAGVVLGFCVGAVVLYQILTSEVTRQLGEYATLKAMGYSNGFLNWVVLQQACIYAVLGFVPGTILAWVLYRFTAQTIHLPLVMTWPRFALAFTLSLSMCIASGYMATQKVHSTDPADLY